MENKSEWSEIFPPTICFSRKIGIGTREIAELLARNSNYQVVDREIMLRIVDDSDLSAETVALFDERYPSKIRDLLQQAFGEKRFVQSDYTRLLFRTVTSVAGLKPTIFIGRGAHLVLPRYRTLAVRFIASKDKRIKRLAEMTKVEENKAEKNLDHIDKEQREFFRTVYGKRDAEPGEFDMIINLDYIHDAQWAAEIVALAFKYKFGVDIEAI
jgi:cytidylate kinase